MHASILAGGHDLGPRVAHLVLSSKVPAEILTKGFMARA